MPRPARRTQASKAVAGQRISSFARVSKGQAFPDAAVKRIAIESTTTTTTTTRKRKAAAATDDEPHPRVASRTESFAPSSDDEEALPAKRARRHEPELKPVVAPQVLKVVVKGKRPAKASPSRTGTAPKPIEATLIAKTRRQGKSVQTKLDGVFKKTTSKSEDGTRTAALPPHLADLVNMHRAFVKTMMIHFAHSGNVIPVDFRTIAPHISRSWGKRQVTIEDVRRCVAVQAGGGKNGGGAAAVAPFVVSDYGRGKVCIELAQNAAPINEERLYRQFEENLRTLCEDKAADDMADVDIPLGSLSLGELPQAAIKDMSVGRSLNPLLRKGQQALSDLKSGIAAKQHDKESKTTTAATTPLLNPDGTKMNLLDRLRLKQLARANEPSPPSPAELQRRAALNRVADVSATVSMLSLSNPLPRQAFTMAVLVERLRDSLRTPISKEEGAACVRLIAGEVAPEWLLVVAIGGRENVVVQRNYQPVDRIINERVQKLLA